MGDAIVRFITVAGLESPIDQFGDPRLVIRVDCLDDVGQRPPCHVVRGRREDAGEALVGKKAIGQNIPRPCADRTGSQPASIRERMSRSSFSVRFRSVTSRVEPATASTLPSEPITGTKIYS